MSGIGITLDRSSINEASVATFARAGATYVRFIAKGMTSSLYLTLAQSFIECGQAVRSNFQVIMDLPGKRPRMGSGFDEITVYRGMTVLLVDEAARSDSYRSNLVVPTMNLLGNRDSVRSGDRLLISDGATELKVLELLPTGILAEATRAEALLSPNRSILLPDTALHYQSLSEPEFGVIEAISSSDLAKPTVALSMVESADPIRQIRNLLPNATIIAKIETRQGLIEREQIIAAADRIMIARGDLSLSLGINFLPAAADLILAECKRQERPVVLATGVFDGVNFMERPSIPDLTDLWYYWQQGVRDFLISGSSPGKYGRQSLEQLNAALGDFRFATEDLGAVAG